MTGPTPPRALRTLYDWTTRLQPSAHRWLYREEQLRLFDQVWIEERPEGRFARVVWATSLLMRSVRAAFSVRFDLWRRRAASRAGRRGGGPQVGSDVRFTLRSLKSSPSYAAAIVGVIAVSMALATTTFAIVDGVLFKPLPYPDADRLMAVSPGLRDQSASLPDNGIIRTASEMLVNTWRSAVPAAGLTGFSVSRHAESGPDVSQDTAGFANIERNFFDVVGVRPLFGGFADSDFADSSDFAATPGYRPVVLMYDTWQSRFGGDTEVIGRVEMLIEQRNLGLRVVGVMPRTFAFPSARETVDFLTPHTSTATTRSNPSAGTFREVVARVPREMSKDQFAERLMPGVAAITQLVGTAPPPRGWSNAEWRVSRGQYDTVSVTPLSTSLARHSKELFGSVALAVVVLVLLTAGNISSLMAARAVERRREIDVRRALGASHRSLIRLWTTEAAVLIGAGSLLGVFLATPFLSLVLSLLPESLVLLKTPRIDWRVAGFVVMLMTLLCAMVSIAPVRSSMRNQPASSLKGGSSERVRMAGRVAVVGGQVATAFVLTTVGACVVGSLLVVYANDRPIRTEGVVVFESRLHGPGGGRTPQDVAERVRRGRVLRERMGRIPGVTAVGLVEAEVMRGGERDAFSRPEGVPRLRGLDSWGVTGAFYRVIEPVLIAGRFPTEHELEAAEPQLVVSERVASAYWPGENPIGQSLTHVGSKLSHTVIGVVEDVRWYGWDQEAPPMIYGPYSRLSSRAFQTFFIRTEADTATTVRQAVQVVAEADPTVRPRLASTLDEMFLSSVKMRRFQSWLFGGFAVAALLVVGIGILGLLAMSAARRTKEVGIRCALGATPGAVIVLMVREQLGAVAGGLVVGGAVAAWAVRLVEAYLYRLTPADPRIWGAAAGLILLMAAVGTLIPAIRASRVDPLQALRTE